MMAPAHSKLEQDLIKAEKDAKAAIDNLRRLGQQAAPIGSMATNLSHMGTLQWFQ